MEKGKCRDCTRTYAAYFVTVCQKQYRRAKQPGVPKVKKFTLCRECYERDEAQRSREQHAVRSQAPMRRKGIAVESMGNGDVVAGVTAKKQRIGEMAVMSQGDRLKFQSKMVNETTQIVRRSAP